MERRRRLWGFQAETYGASCRNPSDCLVGDSIAQGMRSDRLRTGSLDSGVLDSGVFDRPARAVVGCFHMMDEIGEARIYRAPRET